ncbi:molybdopterin molybdotransferase MoeA [Methylomicrobium sp. RS1]|uniref:molybdopterin molybdotransferase MoeA n=1 Tax=Candidatus Methylomicrobium oryzae TaxID=2802053 RepID=UPI0019206310|nr:gephyrin-like molybdotransferase Glp [Methylomicrobium sp. RS1]MBL1264192.1 molybdopterin molybdotransferase MoeA [Methylomicrobium sp. RS1]
MIKIQPACNDIHEPGLIPLNDALTRILDASPPIGGYERVNIENARGRTLAEAITADFNVPGYTNSAVDGYALSGADLPAEGTRILEIAGKAYAGEPFQGRLNPGQCLRIMTGAPMPEGLDTVIMQEHAERRGNTVLIDGRHKPGQNVRRAGEDIRLGQTILHPGKRLIPPDIGLIASLGIPEINVVRKLRIAIASTGNEIFSIGTTPKAGGLYDSNRYSLWAALDRPDIEVINLGIVEDRPDALLNAFEQAAEFADVIVSTGGVSSGEADYTKTALQTSGRIGFWKVALKPGRPFAFGRIGNAVFFGLPGNPVAVMVTFYLLVLPSLEKMLGINNKPIVPLFRARMLDDLRKKPGRTEVPRGIIGQDQNGEWTARSTGNQGSGILSSMSLANALIILEHDRGNVKAGETVWVNPFAGLF